MNHHVDLVFIFKFQFGFVISLTEMGSINYIGNNAPLWTVGVSVGLLLLVLIWIPLGILHQLYTSRKVSLTLVVFVIYLRIKCLFSRLFYCLTIHVLHWIYYDIFYLFGNFSNFQLHSSLDHLLKPKL